MDPQSLVPFYTDLYERILSDSCGDLPELAERKNLKRDLLTINQRVSNEGIGFLTKVLPLLGKAFDSALQTSELRIPRNFAKVPKTNIPAFLQGSFSHVFDSNGSLRENSCLRCVRHIRQVCYLVYKVDFPYDKDQISTVVENFLVTEYQLPDRGASSPRRSDQLLDVAASLIERVFSGFDPKDILPRHGPGVVAGGQSGEDKWLFTHLYDQIHQCYPYYDWFVVGGSRELLDRINWYKSLTRTVTGTAKVMLVPKDSRGPRLISAEPAEYMWLQQGLGRAIMDHVERHPLTKGYVNFTDQSINQELALSSSINGFLATMDLKDASDRVTVDLVVHLFRHTTLLPYLLALRTTSTRLPDGRIVPLKKFAPMGSALCFPVEALCFWALLRATLLRSDTPLEGDRVVYVYGDDIIIPVEAYDECRLTLETYDLRVNDDKSCSTGLFRESCGVDAFAGSNITPAKLRRQWTGGRLEASSYAHYVSFANQLDARGYHNAALWLFDKIEESMGPAGYGISNSPFPCRMVTSIEIAEELNMAKMRSRWNKDFQRWEFRVQTLKSRTEHSKLDGWLRLSRDIFMGCGDTPDLVTFSRSSKIVWRWLPL